MKSDSARDLSSMLTKTDSLLKLYLDYNEFGTKGTKYIAKVLLLYYFI